MTITIPLWLVIAISIPIIVFLGFCTIVGFLMIKDGKIL